MDCETDSPPLWPSTEYRGQIEQLRAAVGRAIYLVELRPTDTKLGIRNTGQAYELLGLIDFPRPDPARGLAPHLLLLDDGRGLNLGRVARISLDRAFGPAPSQILYQDPHAMQGLLFCERTLSHTFIAERSHQALGEVLGRVSERMRLTQHSREEPIGRDR